MTREARTIFLSILTWVIFAVSIFLNQGAFVFPFPLNEVILLLVSIQFFVWNTKKHLAAGILSISAGIVGVLGTQYFWTFFYSPLEMQEFMSGLTTDYFQIAFYFIVLIGILASTLKQKNGIALILSIVSIIPFCWGALSNNGLFLILGYGLMVASTQVKKVYAPYHLLWILLFALKTSEWLTFLL